MLKAKLHFEQVPVAVALKMAKRARLHRGERKKEAIGKTSPTIMQRVPDPQ